MPTMTPEERRARNIATTGDPHRGQVRGGQPAPTPGRFGSGVAAQQQREAKHAAQQAARHPETTRPASRPQGGLVQRPTRPARPGQRPPMTLPGTPDAAPTPAPVAELPYQEPPSGDGGMGGSFLDDWDDSMGADTTQDDWGDDIGATPEEPSPITDSSASDLAQVEQMDGYEDMNPDFGETALERGVFEEYARTGGVAYDSDGDFLVDSDGGYYSPGYGGGDALGYYGDRYSYYGVYGAGATNAPVYYNSAASDAARTVTDANGEPLGVVPGANENVNRAALLDLADVALDRMGVADGWRYWVKYPDQDSTDFDANVAAHVEVAKDANRAGSASDFAAWIKGGLNDLSAAMAAVKVNDLRGYDAALYAIESASWYLLSKCYAAASHGFSVPVGTVQAALNKAANLGEAMRQAMRSNKEFERIVARSDWQRGWEALGPMIANFRDQIAQFVKDAGDVIAKGAGIGLLALGAVALFAFSKKKKKR